MAKQGGEGDQFYIGGYDLSGDVGALSKVSASAKLLDVTGINKFAHERLYGDRDGEISFMSYFNAAAGQEHPALSPLPRTDVLATYMRGSAIGSAAACCMAKEIDYKPKRGQDGSLTLDTQCLANAFGTVWTRAATPGPRTDSGATAGAGLNILGGIFGAEYYFQVMAFTGTDATMTFQDSNDNITYADLAGASFTVSSSTPQAAQVILGGTIRNWVRINTSTLTSFSNLKFAAFIARNNVAVVF